MEKQGFRIAEAHLERRNILFALPSFENLGLRANLQRTPLLTVAGSKRGGEIRNLEAKPYREYLNQFDA